MIVMPKKILLVTIIFCFLLLLGCATEYTVGNPVGNPVGDAQQVSVLKPQNDVNIVVSGESESLTSEEKKMLEENPSRGEPLDKEYISLEEKSLAEKIAEQDLQNTQQAQTIASLTKTFTLEVGDWYFNPEVITVYYGDTVVLNLKSAEGVHGFRLPEFDVNQRISPNKPVTVTFVANKRGEFTFYCNVVCGSGHSAMNGKLVVI